MLLTRPSGVFTKKKVLSVAEFCPSIVYAMKQATFFVGKKKLEVAPLNPKIGKQNLKGRFLIKIKYKNFSRS